MLALKLLGIYWDRLIVKAQAYSHHLWRDNKSKMANLLVDDEIEYSLSQGVFLDLVQVPSRLGVGVCMRAILLLQTKHDYSESLSLFYDLELH